MEEKKIFKNNISKKKKNLEIFSKSINNFIEVVINNFDSNDLNIFNNNIKTLKIKYKNFGFRNLIEKEDTLAEYDPIRNIIYIGNEKSVYHEFFHMLSSTIKNGVLYSGFSQTSFNKKIKHIGYGLNEGYTELLSRRYFVNEKMINTYDTEVYIAGKLEKIIGQKRMESLYSTANLGGLINELIKYDSEDAITKFIEDIDFIDDYFKKSQKRREYSTIVANNLKYINEFLLRIYVKKLQEQLKNNFINLDEFYEQIELYISSLAESIEVDGIFYETITINTVQNILRDILENLDLVITKKDNDGENPTKK